MVCLFYAFDEVGVFDAWNRGEVALLFCQPRSMGHGLNMQAGGRIIIWYTTTWSLELYQQMNARLARQGQTKGVVIYRLCVDGSIDERVCRAIAAKRAGQDALLDAVKAEVSDSR